MPCPLDPPAPSRESQDGRRRREGCSPSRHPPCWWERQVLLGLTRDDGGHDSVTHVQVGSPYSPSHSAHLDLFEPVPRWLPRPLPAIADTQGKEGDCKSCSCRPAWPRRSTEQLHLSHSQSTSTFTSSSRATQLSPSSTTLNPPLRRQPRIRRQRHAPAFSSSSIEQRCASQTRRPIRPLHAPGPPPNTCQRTRHPINSRPL